MNFHIPVMLEEVLDAAPKNTCRRILDCTAGGGGHFFALLEKFPDAQGECWDRDPEAEPRIAQLARARGWESRVRFVAKQFSVAPDSEQLYDFILADLGVSSFQLDDAHRGMSFQSDSAVDFRMNPSQGPNFFEWLRLVPERELAEILEAYGEEPKGKKVASFLKTAPADALSSGRKLGEAVGRVLNYGSPSRTHPATRVFQALRIAINDEFGELKSLLAWGPRALAPGGRLAIISFHSLEDRFVKNHFRDAVEASGAKGTFALLGGGKPISPTDQEATLNPRSRSAKLRGLERTV